MAESPKACVRGALIGGVLPPAHLSREGRIRMLGELAHALLAGDQPDRSAALFLGGALIAWLEHGGSLERDYLRVSARAGSHQTAASIWRGLQKPVPFEEGRDSGRARSSAHLQSEKGKA